MWELRGPACVRLPEQGLAPPSTRNGEAGGGVTIFLISLVNPPGLAGVGTWRMLSGIARVTVFIYLLSLPGVFMLPLCFSFCGPLQPLGAK